jgi:hypothetical protein
VTVETYRFWQHIDEGSAMQIREDGPEAFELDFIDT